MEGDPRNPRVSLLKKYDIPIEHLSYEFVEKCSNKKELERIIRILRSGEEGNYPDLLKITEERLRLFAPESRVLRVETPILTKDCLTKEEWSTVENELLSWEEEMNIVDKSLDYEKGRIELVGNKNLPEVRKITESQFRKNKTEKKTKIIDKNNQRIKSGDYVAWDKFDVDKELLKLDVEEERKQEENEKKKREAKKLEKEKKIEIMDVEKENYTSMEQQVLANQAKDRGNECYKSGDLESALKYYGISINLYCTANAYNNRAMTYLKLKQYENALEDCNKALHLEGNNVKALYRRATAYQFLSGKNENGNYDQLALKDLYQIITLEPNNKVAQMDIQKLKKKLNIEDSGKKFRMPICEDLDAKGSTYQSEEKSSNLSRMDHKALSERLPLTYYGPSTSTFQCEPYSIVHRALSGSSTFGQVLCKCNSSRPRQNPLCQRCGEAMSTPKPRMVANTNLVSSSKKKDIETKSLVEYQTNNSKSDNKSSDLSNIPAWENKAANDIENISKINSIPGVEVNEENHLKEKVKSVETENKKNSININKPNEVELSTKNPKTKHESQKPVDDTENSLIRSQVSLNNSEKSSANAEIIGKNVVTVQAESAHSDQMEPLDNEIVKTVEHVSNKNSGTKITDNSSSQNDVNHNSKKSKTKKKKSKEHKESRSLRQHVEPIRVVHAAKYLHPTSVEPKTKSESPAPNPRESSFSTNLSYKDFVPNRKCYSTECQRIDFSASKAPPSASKKPFSPTNEDKPNNDLFLEGNKENILKNNCDSNNEIGKTEGVADDVKKEVVDSAFEFIKAWEELKKFDESYAKRAEIIRKLRPNDLSKVIGIKLDSDMLSCLIECLLRHFVETDPKRVVELLKQLPQVPRFGLVSMFLPNSDKKKIKKLIEIAEDKGFKLDEDVKKNLTILS